MPIILGSFQGDRPVISLEITVGVLQLGKSSLLVDTGATHILLVLAAQNTPFGFPDTYRTWPEETFYGVGTLRVRRSPTGTLRARSKEGQVVEVPVEPLHVLLYDVDDSGFTPLTIPPSLIGFQHAAFGLSQLLVDNASQRVLLTYQEPFTPTRLE